MSKAVLISIQPKWCELIADGKKTIEIRKTRPRLAAPFKCYIYCTKPKKILRYVWGKEDYAGYGEPYTQMRDDEKVFCKIPDGSSAFCSPPYSGKVIGEFVCERVESTIENIVEGGGVADIERKTRLSAKELIKYANGKEVYAWFISDLKIYDKPIELSDFTAPCDHTFDEVLCSRCNRFDNGKCFGKLRRAPQSWCYVEEAIK